MNGSNVSARVEYSYAFAFERNFDKLGTLQMSSDFFRWSCVTAVLYLVLIIVGQILMKNRPAYDLRPALVVWNTALALFSFCGSLRMLPELYHVVKHFGFRFSICVDNSDVANPVTGLWAYLFALSKFLELGDTAFVILRKKKLIFLHWFHHSTVLVFTFLLAEHRAPMCRWFANMNCCVHAFMYSYFALQAAGCKLSRKVAACVTAAQIAQMIAGFVISLRVFLIWWLDPESCSITGLAANTAMALYAFYFSLFLNFFFQTYLKSKSLRLKEDSKNNSQRNSKQHFFHFCYYCLSILGRGRVKS